VNESHVKGDGHMSILDFLRGSASSDLIRQLESANPNARLAAAFKVARTRDKAKAVEPLIRHYEDQIGISGCVRTQWEMSLKNWRQNGKLMDVVDSMKLDQVTSYHQGGVTSRLRELIDLIDVLEGIAKSLRLHLQ
jgi:hypothetical protein